MSVAMFRRLARTAESFATRCDFERALAVTAGLAGIATEDVKLKQPGRHARRAAPGRPAAASEAIYLSVVQCERSQRAVARATGVTVQAVNKAISSIENCRDDHSYDRLVDEMQLALMGGAACV